MKYVKDYSEICKKENHCLIAGALIATSGIVSEIAHQYFRREEISNANNALKSINSVQKNLESKVLDKKFDDAYALVNEMYQNLETLNPKMIDAGKIMSQYKRCTSENVSFNICNRNVLRNAQIYEQKVQMNHMLPNYVQTGFNLAVLGIGIALGIKSIYSKIYEKKIQANLLRAEQIRKAKEIEKKEEIKKYGPKSDAELVDNILLSLQSNIKQLNLEKELENQQIPFPDENKTSTKKDLVNDSLISLENVIRLRTDIDEEIKKEKQRNEQGYDFFIDEDKE